MKQIDRAELEERVRERFRQSEDRDALVSYLHDLGLSKLETIRVLVTVGMGGLGELKVLVHNHPTWQHVRKLDDDFHRQLEQVFEAAAALEDE
jgi:hypothetical protein